MREALFYLLIWLIALGLLAAIGHGIWIALAWLIRALFGLSRDSRRGSRRRCPYCRLWTARSHHRCAWCGRDLLAPLAAELADLEGLNRQLTRFQAAGILKSEEADDLLARATQYRRRLMGEPVEEPREAAPIVAEVVEEPRKPETAPRASLPGTPFERGAARPSAVPKPAPQAEPPAVAKEQPPAAPVPVSLVPPKPAPPAALKPPRKSWLEVLTAFLEERNIRWAELVGGLLMVGASVALVISLREQLAAVPLFKFSVFVVYSSAVFGAGLFAHYRWKLESTSRALLVIATLLVPLNFLAMASLSKDNWTLLNVAWEAVSLGVFIYLVGLAAGVLAPRARWLQSGAVVANSALVLVLARLSGVDSNAGMFLAAGALPVAVFAAPVGRFLYRTADREDLDPGRAAELFSLVGTAVFAAAVALGLLVARAVEAEGIGAALDRSSVLFALAALPILAAGLTIVRGTSRDRSLGAYRAAGTMIALVAATVMFAALGMAWPHPLGLIAVGGLNAAALALVAFRYRFPIAHAGAIACAALVYLTGYHVFVAHNLALIPAGDASRRTLQLATSAESGAALVGLFVLLGLAAELLARRGQRPHAEQYVGGSAVVAVVSLLVVTIQGLASRGADAPVAVAVYGIYGVGSLLLNARFRKPLLTYLGLGFLAGATLWALWWRTGRVEPIWATILAAEALAMGVAAVLLHGGDCPDFRAAKMGLSPSETASDRSKLIDAYRIPLLHVAEAVGPIALAIAVWTAWTDADLLPRIPTPVVTAVYLAALYVLLAWDYRSVWRTWAGSMVALVGLVHTLVFNYTGYLDLPWLDALLAHATLAVLGGVLLEAWTRQRPALGFVDDVRRVFVKPLGETALLSSALAVPVFALVSWQETISLSACLFWLGGIWLVIAWTHRWPAMLAAGQAVLTLAVAVGTTAWLQHHPWDTAAPVDLLDPRSLQAYGIGLGLLTLSWLGVRILLRRNPLAGQLLNPGWPSVDRIVGHAVVALQLLVVAVHLLPGFWQELGATGVTPVPRGAAAVRFPTEAFGPTAWLLVIVLASALLLALWNRWRAGELASSLLLAATVPCLVAARFAGHQATASALRWGLAVGLGAFSAAVWHRGRLLRLVRQVGGVIEVGARGPSVSRTVLLATTAGPILALTVVAALMQMAGISPDGPAGESFFFAIGPKLSYLVPLAVVMGCLVAFALREVSAGYAFSAGLVAKMTVVLAYLLGVVTSGRAIGTADVVTVLQLLTVTAAGWAVVWTIGRRWTDAWMEGPRPGSARVLMNVQLGMAAAAGALVWVPAVLALVLYPPSWQAWAIAAGSWLGWFALAMAVAAGVYCQLQRGRSVQPGVAGLVGMVTIGLLACTIRGLPQMLNLPQLAPEWGYRTLMLGWGMYALFVVLITWWVASVRTLPGAKGPPQALIRAAAGWVSAAGLLAVLLGLKAAFLHHLPEDLLWAAAAIALASAAGAAMSVWRRREGWAFAAAWGVNLAASLVVWYYQRELAFHQWWILLVQANVIATAAVALVWLAARKRLYELRELSLGTSPLLAMQTVFAVAGNVMLLVVPVIRLVAMPAALPDWAAQLAQPPGWIALVLAVAAAAWYLRQVSPENLFHTLAGLGLGIGVLVTCSTADTAGRLTLNDWLSYHVLFTSWAAAGLAVLGLGMLGRNLLLAAETDPDATVHRAGTGSFFGPLRGEKCPCPLAAPVFPSRHVQAWVTAIGAVVVGLALVYTSVDPVLPWWSVRAVLAAGVMAGVLAMWLRLGGYVFVSGLLINAAGTVMWMAWGPESAVAAVYVNALCLGIGSCLWTLLGCTHPHGVPVLEVGGRELRFAPLAAQVGLATLGVVVVISAVGNVAAVSETLALFDTVTNRLGWLALAAAAVATTFSLWDRSARFSLTALYCAGLVGLGMGLAVRGLSPREYCWTAGHELAGFVLLLAALAWMIPRMRPVWRALWIPAEDGRIAPDWFPEIQAAAGCVAVALGVWISTDFAFDGISHPAVGWISGRMAGPLATAALLAAAILTAGLSPARWRSGWQYAVFALGALVIAELSWAWLPPDWGVPWLHRNVMLMCAAVIMALAVEFGLARILPAGSDWITAGRRMLPVLGGLALVLLAVVLVQEAVLFEPPDGTPMALAAVVVVAGALVGLVVAGLSLALVPQWEPFGLSDRGRTVYVYAAEVLAALVGVHLWLTMPWLFRLGIVEDYWMLMVMAGAFVGAGLSELFHRRGMPVLSEPLERTAALLPLAPAILFWLPFTPPGSGFAGASPAFWFLGTLFYGYMAASKRSPLFGLAAMVTANVGLCVLWHECRWEFLEYPQLWLIPVGLSALLAEHLNYDRLTKAQASGLRYLGLSLIYVPCTVEFLDHLGDSFWLPVVLIFLSVLGVMGGVMLRIRSFVLLGFTFLVLVIVTMICHAAFAEGDMWVFWVFCILLGAAIIALVAFFEKRREQILAAVTRFRQWERRAIMAKDE